MIVTLTGENDFARSRELQQLRVAFEQEHGALAVERLDGQDVTLERIQEALTSLPFLAAKKLVILREPSSLKAFTDQAEQFLTGLPETTEVIIVEPKLDKRLAYYKFLKQQTDFRDLTALDQAGLVKWLVKTAKTKEGSLSSSDAHYLVQRVGSDQQLLANEIEKLLLYSPSITRKTIDLMTEASSQSTVFTLLEAAFAGDHRTALELYNEQRSQKVEAQQIIAMLSWQLHVLAISKAAGDRDLATIAKEAKLNPFVLRKNQALVQRLNQSDIKQLVSDLLHIDVQSKRSNIDADEALQNYLLQLADY